VEVLTNLRLDDDVVTQAGATGRHAAIVIQVIVRAVGGCRPPVLAIEIRFAI